MKHRIRLRAGDVSSTQGDGYVKLEFEDVISGIHFLDIEMSYAEFGKLVKGCTSLKLEGDFRGLEHIGMRYVREPRTRLCNLDPFKVKRAELEQWLQDHAQEEGWSVNSYLGSRDSVVSNREGPGCLLYYGVFKYVPTTPEEREALAKQRPW